MLMMENEGGGERFITDYWFGFYGHLRLGDPGFYLIEKCCDNFFLKNGMVYEWFMSGMVYFFSKNGMVYD